METKCMCDPGLDPRLGKEIGEGTLLGRCVKLE